MFIDDNNGYQNAYTEPNESTSGTFIGENPSSELDDYWGSQEEYINSEPDTEPREHKEVNLGYKSVAFILAGLFIVLALILVGVSKINVNKRETPKSTQSTEVVQQSTEQVANTSGVNLIEVGSNISLNYSESILETDGVITAKKIFLVDSQLIYRLDVSALGTKVSYYCNYASYKSVNTGDKVLLKYQLVDEDYISVLEITR